jgi:3-hydroxybutyryl-CoA dehydrogenase
VSTEVLRPVQVKRIGIVGSGIMGSGIAEVAAKAGFEVVLRSRAQSSADAMVAALERSLEKQVTKGRLDDEERRIALENVTTVTDLDDLADVHLVIESVVEDLATKAELFGQLDRICGPDTILASNTSTLSVGAIASHTGRADRVCGVHFFNPAPIMPLVELVVADATAPETLVAARAFVESCGKTVVEVRDRAGFVVNALLFPYLNNAVKLLDDGIASRDDIDTAMKGGCGYPMGPLELLDLVGLDTSMAILDALHDCYGDPSYEPARLLRELVGKGHLGTKSAKGFYDYPR